MSIESILLYVILTLIGFVLSALFSGMETGLYTINRVRLAVRADQGERNALRLRRELSKLGRALSVLLIGNNGANYLGSFGLAALLAGFGFRDWPVIGLPALLVTPLLFIFGETLPKDLFRTHTDHWTYWLSPALTFFRWLFLVTGLLPIVQLVGSGLHLAIRRDVSAEVTARQRVSQMIREGVGAGVISEAQTTLADRALSMRGRTVRSEMVPWANVVAVPVNASRRDRETLMRLYNYTRMPVIDRNGRVVGLLSTMEAVFAADTPTSELVLPAQTFDPSTPVYEALRVMRAERRKMAVVIDPATKRPLGLVTLKDLVEPLTGALAVW
jgi:CBS domain containing-hemolysin-like protein